MRYPFDGTYRITQPFGQKNAALTGGTHQGTDYGCPNLTPIKAITAGQVLRAGFAEQMGNHVWIQTGRLIHKYFHLSTIAVKVGQAVSEGQNIGGSGKTGLTTGYHLHLQTEIDGIAVDPERVINNPGIVPSVNQPSPQSGGSLVVKPGNTFWGLEEANGWPHGTLQQLNPQIDPKQLKIGQTINIPQKTTPPEAPQATFYDIKAGDTLWALENAWRIPHGSLQQLNPGIDPRKLRVGQRIRRS